MDRKRSGRDGVITRQPTAQESGSPAKRRSKMAGSGSLVDGAADRRHHSTPNDPSPIKKPPRPAKQEREGTTEGGGGSCKRLKRAMEPIARPQSKPGETSKLSLKRNTKSNFQHTDTVKRARGSPVPAPEITVVPEEADKAPQDLGLSTKTPSKLPVPEKPKLPEDPPPTHQLDEPKAMLTKIETERVENPINLALAHRIEELQAEHERLLQENSELREELDLMEFRMLEIDTSPKRAVSRGSETRFDLTEIDDVSDSGVMSLPTSEDDPQEFGIEGEREKDVKWRLMEMCRGVETVADRICLQQAMALIRHQEARLEGLEATIAAISHEARSGGESECKRIVATVPPFSEPRCLEESCVFVSEADCGGASRGTQTEGAWGEAGDLSQELRKLSRVRERIEERGAEPKEVIFYRERVEALEHRLQVFESSGDARVRALAKQVQRETLLEAKVKQLNQKVARLEAENRRVEEERCELEEAENDTRLRCQKLELKLSALGEKKAALKVQIEEATRAMANLQKSLESEERKKNEARLHASRMEALVQSYEQKNMELEERELEVRYRLQVLENTMPALMMWNMWKMMALQGGGGAGLPITSKPGTSQVPLVSEASTPITLEDQLLIKLSSLERQLNVETKRLEESKEAEEELKEKVKALESHLNRKDKDILDILDRDPDQDVEVFEKLSKMARERLEMDKRIKDLELKEKLYQETLQQADSMFAEMEGGYVEKMKKKEEELETKEAKLMESESKLKLQSAEMSSHLQERIDALEAEVTKLKNCISKKEREHEALEAEEKRLYKELQETSSSLDEIKRDVDGPLRVELEQEKKKNKTLKDRLHKLEEEILTKEDARSAEESNFKRQISRLNRDMMENEVTISELKEEVQTLEAEVIQLRRTLAAEKERSATRIEELEAKLEVKDKTLEELQAVINSDPHAGKEKSLKEELEEEDEEDLNIEEINRKDADYNGGGEMLEDIPEEEEGYSTWESDELFLQELGWKPEEDDILSDEDSNEMIDQEIITSKGGFREVSTENVMSSSSGIVTDDSMFLMHERNSVNETIFEANEESFSQGVLKKRGRKELMEMLIGIKKSQPLVGYTTTDVRGGDIVPPIYLPECLAVHKAITGVGDKDINSAMDALNKAYHHSKGNDGYLEYGGQPSTLETNDVGPGTVAWNPRNNPSGYRIKPTKSSLQLVVDELREKCRIKDHIIQQLANELRQAELCQGWSDTNLLDALQLAPNPPLDFDRTGLICYLRERPYHTLEPYEDEKAAVKAFQATNPLGLAVVRQVGPDSLLLEWNPPPPQKRVYAFEIFINGLFVQRVRSPGRNKALIHPIDLSSVVYVTLNAVSYQGNNCDGATIHYPVGATRTSTG